MSPTSIERELLVSTDWVDQHRNDDNVRIVESDEDLLLYQQGHIREAVMIDVRSPGEYTGEMLHMEDYPQEGALRAGHIPGAASVPWSRAVNDDGTFKSEMELEKIYLDEAGLKRDGDTIIAYCRIGERSSHTWFVLKYLLGFDNVKNYDGSWTEWGNLVGVPIEKNV